jgi:hypothetical protein
MSVLPFLLSENSCIFLCGFRGGSTPGTFVGLNKSLWFCWNVGLCVCGFLCNNSNLRLFC